MAIAFNGISSALRVPFVGVEFDASKAQQGPALLQYRMVVIGQKLAAGSAAAMTVRLDSSPYRDAFVTASAYSTRGGASDDVRGDDGKGDGRKPASVACSAASNCAPT